MRKVVDSRTLGLYCSQVGSSALRALKLLKQKGFEAYVVGGCVRDLLLHKPPKDFDVVTTANLMQVRKHFQKLGRTMIVGRRFPICLVYISGAWIEVSSFETLSKCSVKSQKFTSQIHVDCGPADRARWENCMKRDFTINSLLYDPYSNKIYDYVNGLNDVRASKVCTVAPAHISFTEDCARILRGIRIAARLGLDFSEETQAAILDRSSLISTLSKERLLMEMNYMLAYGAAMPSINLLKRFKLLEILLPFQASYLTHHEGSEGGQSSSLLMKLFSHLDELLAADHPSDCKLWLALLAFHLALMKCPENALTIWTFCSILCYGERMDAINFAKANVKNTNYFPEILPSSEAKADDLLLEDVSRFASVVKSSLSCLRSSDDLTEALKIYPQSPSFISKVFVSRNMTTKVGHVFDIFFDETSTIPSKRSRSIDYRLLKDGDVNQVRLSLGKVIMNTLCSENNGEGKQPWMQDGDGRNVTKCADLKRVEEAKPVCEPLQVEGNAISKNKTAKRGGFERRENSANLKGHEGKKLLHGTGTTTKRKKRKLSLMEIGEKKPTNKPLQAAENVNSEQNTGKDEGLGFEKMENLANLRRYEQSQGTNSAEGAGSLHSGSDVKQKIQTILETSSWSMIKQQKSDCVVRGGDGSQKITGRGQRPQLSKLFG